MKDFSWNKTKTIFTAILIVGFTTTLFAQQVPATEKRYVRIGSLQSRFSAYGAERGWNNSYYEGMIWPADYNKQDNAVIEMATYAVDDFTDAFGRHWDKYGIYLGEAYVAPASAAPGVSLFPVELKQTSKYPAPQVYVDGLDVMAPYAEDIDEVDPDIIADRIISNVVNTSMGLTIDRKIYAFSQQYHDNYFIKVYTLTNTGNIDYDDEIELQTPLKGLRFGWGVRYAVCYEGAYTFDGAQSYGKHTWVTRRGEDYADHMNESITESNSIVDWLRAAFAWTGQSSTTVYDNIGAPNIRGLGRLASPQHAGTVIIHVDKSATDKSDDPNQPAVLGWHAGDSHRPNLGSLNDETAMVGLYNMLSGNPYKGLGSPSERFYEENCPTITSKVDPFTIHNDGGGTHIWIAYGPFDLQHGESITIVEAEGVSGLSREMCETIGRRWKQAYDNPSDTGPFTLPDNSTTTDKDFYKNSWVYTGWDSIMQTFGRAKRTYDLNFDIPQPPAPPAIVEINSGGDQISVKWVPSDSENDADFGGYRVFRAVGKPDTVFTEIFACGKDTDHPEIVNEYNDKSPVRGFAYYYYIEAFNDGSNNTTGQANPTGPLHSSHFYTKTTEPAFLQRKAGDSLKEIIVVPNPYNIKARDLNYPKEENKIAFLDVPAYCTIKIYTERGDLIKTIHHSDGSGDEYWDLTTSTRQLIVSGIYIAYFEVSQDYRDPETNELLYKKGANTYRKFAIVR
ncbi:MAG: fibronectin [Calditrichaeota bacterium]|nr:fibronectin [Calditrichota bacterium]